MWQAIERFSNQINILPVYPYFDWNRTTKLHCRVRVVYVTEYRQFVSAQVVQESAGRPMPVEAVDSAAVRPVRSASPFFGVFSSYERPHKTQHHHHHHHHHEEEYEPEYHHRPQHHKPQHHHQSGGGAGSFASAGSFAGGQGGGGGHSQSVANSQSANFGFGPFQASYSASSAHSGSHSGGG